MTKKISTSSPTKGGASRDQRLKAALKANLQRRKAQARARAEKSEDEKTR